MVVAVIWKASLNLARLFYLRNKSMDKDFQDFVSDIVDDRDKAVRFVIHHIPYVTHICDTCFEEYVVSVDSPKSRPCSCGGQIVKLINKKRQK